MIETILTCLCAGFLLSLPFGAVGFLVIELFLQKHNVGAWGIIIGEGIIRSLALALILFNSKIIESFMSKQITTIFEGGLLMLLAAYIFEQRKKENILEEKPRNELIPSIIKGMVFAQTGLAPFIVFVIKFGHIKSSYPMYVIFICIMMYCLGTWLLWNYRERFINILSAIFKPIRSQKIYLILENFSLKKELFTKENIFILLSIIILLIGIKTIWYAVF